MLSDLYSDWVWHVPKEMFCSNEYTKGTSHPFPCALPLNFSFPFVFACKPHGAPLKVWGFRVEIPTLLFRLRHHHKAPVEIRNPQFWDCVYIYWLNRDPQNSMTCTHIEWALLRQGWKLQWELVSWEAGCNWVWTMVLVYQIVFLHSVSTVLCRCTQTTYCELEGLCAAQCGHAFCPCSTGRGCRRLVSVLFAWSFLQVGKKRCILQGFCLLLCLELWKTKHQGRLKSRSCIHLHHCQITVLTSESEELEGILDMSEAYCQGTLSSVLFIQDSFLLIIKEFRRKLPSSLKIFVSLNKYTVWKCRALKDTFISNSLC